MYAIIKTGGKQYRVQSGDVLDIEKIDKAAGDTIKFDEVLAVSGDDGLKVGSPLVKGASVSAEVVDQFRDKKLVCLLYTSPSPRDLSTSRMPSSA